MYFLLRYFLVLIYVIESLNGLIDNVTYSSIKWPFDYQFNDTTNQIERPNLSNLINLYNDYRSNLIQIDDDPKYNRENQQFDDDASFKNTTINKSESEFRPTIDPI